MIIDFHSIFPNQPIEIIDFHSIFPNQPIEISQFVHRNYFLFISAFPAPFKYLLVSPFSIHNTTFYSGYSQWYAVSTVALTSKPELAGWVVHPTTIVFAVKFGSYHAINNSHTFGTCGAKVIRSNGNYTHTRLSTGSSIDRGYWLDITVKMTHVRMVRGSSPRNCNFLNGPKIVSEWSNLL